MADLKQEDGVEWGRITAIEQGERAAQSTNVVLRIFKVGQLLHPVYEMPVLSAAIIPDAQTVTVSGSVSTCQHPVNLH